MVVICDECGLKYQIDPTKIVGERARFKCKGCSNSIIVEKDKEPEDDATMDALDETLFGGPSSADESTEDSSSDVSEEASADVSVAEGASAVQAAPAQVAVKKTKGLGLTTKIIFLMLLVSLLPIAINFALSFTQANQRIITETTNEGTIVSNMLIKGVDEWVDKNIGVLKAVARMPEMISMNQFQQEQALKAIQAEYPWMYLVFTTDDRGMNVARSDGKPLLDYSNRQYVKDVVTGADYAWQNLIGKTSKLPALVLAAPIKDGDNVVGVIAAAMTREAISKLVTNYKRGKTGLTFLVDQDGKVIAHQNEVMVQQEKNLGQHPLVKAATRDRTARVQFVDGQGKDVLGFSQKNKNGWVIATQQDLDEAFATVKKEQLFTYMVLVGTIIVVLVISLLTSRAIVRPIKKLTDAANRISIGDLDVEIGTNFKDEIADLADAVTRMQESIRLSLTRLKRRRR